MNLLLIIDRIGYKKNDDKYKKIASQEYSNVETLYTRYEDRFIRKVRNLYIIGNALQHIFRWFKSLKYSIYAITKKNTDEIICLNPIVGIIMGILNTKRKKLIVCGFLFEPKNNKLYYELRKMITKLSLKKINKVVVYSNKEVKYYESVFNMSNKFVFVPYGIDYMDQKEYSLNELPKEYLFSGGGSNRDYKTLINAYNKSSKKEQLVIATQLWRVKDFEVDNCIVLTNVVNETFGDVLKKSKCLILSLKDANISAGHMVMLQAMSLGVPIIVNDIPAVRDYVDEKCVQFYHSGNEEELIYLIDNYLQNQNISSRSEKAKKMYEEEYTSFNLINRLIEL